MVGGEGDDRGWDGWMASPTQWTRVWANTESWWWTGRYSMLRSMVLQRVRHDWVTEVNWIVLEKILESPLYGKEFTSVSPKGNQPWIFTGRTDAEAPILWPPDVKSQLIGKDPDAGQDWKQKEKGIRWLDSTTDSMDMNLRKLQEIVEDREACSCSPWGRKESHIT